MQGDNTYAERLEQALDRKLQHLETQLLPGLKEQFEQLHGAFKNFFHLLLRKSLIQEDPYKYEKKISEVTIPSGDAIQEGSRSNDIDTRLSDFDSQLEFLTTYYQFSTDFLTLSRIKLLLGLATFIRWDNISESSTHINTRALAKLVSKIKGGSDSFSTQLVNDAQNQMAKTTQVIGTMLKDLTRYHKERYKLEVRKMVLEPMSLDTTAVMNDRSTVVNSIKKRFATALPGRPLYLALVEEALDEDHSAKGKSKQDEIIGALRVAESQERKKEAISHKSILIEAIRLLSTGNSQIQSALNKLDKGSKILEDEKMRMGGPLRRLLSRLFHGKNEDRIYEIEFIDVATSVSRTSIVNFDEFYKKGIRTLSLLKSMIDQVGAGMSQVESLNEEKIYKILESSVSDIKKMHITMPALYSNLQADLSRESREKLASIKLELNAIQNAIVKANQKRQEYVAQREEQEQLKKLGIKKADR